MEFFELKTTDIGYLERLLFNEYGELNILSHEQLRDFPQEDISQLCVKHGMYCLPTKELIDFIKKEIGGEEDSTIEIGAGNGAIGKALGIRCTDSYQQNNPYMKSYYELLRQPIVKYGKHVEQFDALEAVRVLRPKTVVAAWCTHKYNPKEHWREGNEYGIDELKMLKKIKKYIFIGNSKVHGKKPILSVPYLEVNAGWLLSRSMNRDLNVIWVWDL